MPLKLARFRRQRYSTIPVPISARTRVASVSRNKIEIGNLRRFPSDRWHELEMFLPHVLIGSSADLKMLATLSDAGAIEISSVDTAIFVASELGASAITDVERVVFWQAFAVPVYEVLISRDGRLMASECEAHAGWHLEPGIPHGRILPGRIETSVCACGRKEPRVFNTTQLQGETLAAIA